MSTFEVFHCDNCGRKVDDNAFVFVGLSFGRYLVDGSRSFSRVADVCRSCLERGALGPLPVLWHLLHNDAEAAAAGIQPRMPTGSRFYKRGERDPEADPINPYYSETTGDGLGMPLASSERVHLFDAEAPSAWADLPVDIRDALAAWSKRYSERSKESASSATERLVTVLLHHIKRHEPKMDRSLPIHDRDRIARAAELLRRSMPELSESLMAIALRD